MQNIAKIYEKQSTERFFGKARFKRNCENNGQIIVALAGFRPGKEIMASLAIHLNHKLVINDELLVIEDNSGNFFVIGDLTQNGFYQSPAKTVVSDGTYASINADENNTLGIYSNKDKLLFEYDPETKKAKIYSDADNVVFEAVKGNLEFKAAGNIHLNGHQVDVSGKAGIGLTVGKKYEKSRSGLALKPGKIDVSSQEVKVSARRAGFFIEEVKNNIKTLVSKIGSVRLVVDKLETTASSIIEKAKNTYRTTENLNQVKAGRMRMLIDRTFHIGSKTTVIKAKDDVKVKGEKIHLG